MIANIYFVDVFLGGEFSTYGIEVLGFLEADPENRIDPMATIFPRVTKCSFFKYGPSGTVQTLDSICVLPVNIMNEKVGHNSINFVCYYLDLDFSLFARSMFSSGSGSSS